MIDPVLLDFESVSRVDLKRSTGRLYWADPSTAVLCCAWYDTNSGELGVWLPGQEWPHHGRVLGAHNMAGFDRFGCDRCGWSYAGLIDTSGLARKAGLPGALDELAKRWLGREKDHAGSKFTRGLSTCRRPAGKGPDAIPPAKWNALPAAEKRRRGKLKPITPEILLRVIEYCLDDVGILAHGWPMLREWIDVDADVSRVDRIINDRGVPFDGALAEALLECDATNSAAVIDSVVAEINADRPIAEHTTPDEVRDAARSNDQFREITGSSNAQKATVESIDHPLARARLALNTIAGGKLIAGLLRTSPDGRMRDTHRYYGGHTGRWSSKGMQLHNLSRPDDRFEMWSDDQICALADAVIAREHVADHAEINLLLRATIAAPPGQAFAVCDFSGVEARALAWAAHDTDALAMFAAKRNPYFTAASLIYGVPYDSISKGTMQYTIGKIAELALGYQGAVGAFKKLADQQGIDLSGIDIVSVVKAWRRAHGPTVRLWYDAQRAYVDAVGGQPTRLSCFDFCAGDDSIAVVLPSGRPLVYNDARVSDDGRTLSYYGPGDDPKVLRAMCRVHARELAGVRKLKPSGSRGWCSSCGREVEAQLRTPIYGGKIVENIIQALCRDLLARSLVLAEEAGLNPVMTVHDEIVCLVPEQIVQDAYDLLCALMCDLPGWALGFPIGAAGFVGRRYRK